MIRKLYNILSLKGRLVTAALLYIGIGLMLNAMITPQISSGLFAQGDECGGEQPCAPGETCCNGYCCDGICCDGNCVSSESECCGSDKVCAEGEKCCHGNCIPENSECCEDGTHSNCGCCLPNPEAEKTTAADCKPKL